MVSQTLLILVSLVVVASTAPETLMFVSENSEDDPCDRYDVDGCSVPFGLPFFYKDQFTEACDRHDICYSCGVSYGFSKEDCDNNFHENTLATCDSDYLTAPADSPETSTSTTHSQQVDLVRLAVQDLGTEGVAVLLRDEMAKATDAPPRPGLPEFNTWFSRPVNQVNMAAAWVKMVAEHAHRLEASHPRREHGAAVSDSAKSRRVRRERAHLPRRTTANEFQVEVSTAVSSMDDIPTVGGESITSVSSIISYLVCDFFSEVYYLAVAIFGESSYHTDPEWYCNQSFVPQCLPDC